MTITTAMQARVAELLGREPRGLREISVTNSAGDPVVIRVASLVDDKPFPTLYWLVDPQLNYRIDQLEAGGQIGNLQHRIDESEELQLALRADHRAYIATRNAYIDAREQARIDRLGFAQVLAERGIGGIADFGRIRCLHTWYAAHLVTPNTVGRMVDAIWQENSVLEN